MSYQGQDWEPIKIEKSRPTTQSSGPRRNPEAQRLAKLAAAEEPERVKVLTRESIAAMVAYRRANNLTQRHLDQMMSFPPNTVNRLEARNMTPTSTMLNALNRVLKTGLKLEEV